MIAVISLKKVASNLTTPEVLAMNKVRRRNSRNAGGGDVMKGEAKQQYGRDRNNQELLFQFKRRVRLSMVTTC